MQKIEVFKIPMSAPDDLSLFKKMINDKQIIANDIIAVLGKTEGNGCVNDFTRALTTTVYKSYLAHELKMSETDVLHKVAFVMSGGTEGVMSPHATVFTKKDVEPVSRDGKYLVASSGYTRDFLPEEIGTTAMVEEVARVVKKLNERCRTY